MDIGAPSQALAICAIFSHLATSAVQRLEGWHVPEFEAGGVLCTLWCFWVSCVHWRLILLPYLLLIPQLLYWLDCRFIKAILVSLPPRYNIGNCRRRSFIDCTDPTVGFFDISFSRAIFVVECFTPVLYRSWFDVWRLHLNWHSTANYYHDLVILLKISASLNVGFC